MSGIAGLVHIDGAPIEPGSIEKMTAAMAQRGPDGIHHWQKSSVALGQCMLHTTPESLEEKQPLNNEDESLVLVMDGRVDNWQELRHELLGRGAVLRDRSDAELVLRAYESWGENCLDRIVGEFVFFIWNSRQRQLFGARDAAGTRHFYYHAGNGWFAFASEIKGLLALDRIEPRLNESRLLDYIVDEFDRDDEIGTFYQGVSRLPAGHALRVTEGCVKTWRYWDPGQLPVASFKSLDECVEAFMAQLRIAVQCRLRSFGPVGAALSGGMDSSSIVGLIRTEFRDELRNPLKTFSLIRDDRENCSDWRAIREMLSGDWLDATVITSALPDSICRNYLESIGSLEEPFALSQGFIPSLVYASAHNNGCRVVFDGMAGDLLFYGLDRSLDYILKNGMFRQIPHLLGAARRHGARGGLKFVAWKALRQATPKGVINAYRRFRDARRLSQRRLSHHPGDPLSLLHRNVAMQFLGLRLDQRWRIEAQQSQFTDQASHARCFTTGLLSFAHEVNGQIALSMGVEPRSPFSDRRIIEFAVQMPVAAKLSIPWYKHVLRSGTADILPESVRWRSDIGQNPGWMFYRRIADAMHRDMPNICERGYLDAKLSKWIDVSNLDKSLNVLSASDDGAQVWNVLNLAILARWLDAQCYRFPAAMSA